MGPDRSAAGRWQRLFDDLEAEYDAGAAAELEIEVATRARGEWARLGLVDRLRPAIGHPLVLHTSGAAALRGTLCGLGPDWLLLAEAAGDEVVVPLASLLSVSGLGARSAAPGSEGQVVARLALGHALRGIARRRAGVAITLLDGSVLHGTLDRVGADFVELAEHPAGEPRRAPAVSGVRALPFSALACVRAS
ncbi:MAG TPA: hypothetical protein VNB94_13285 [Mycobacteriales bacterium]|nr:hypothetical protein [Mycobacteriales bacterium]